jgi:antitoxin ParD1/3/4
LTLHTIEERAMNIELPPDQQAFLAGLVATGQFDSVGEAVREGVGLLISREDLKRQVQVGIDQADRGELIDHETVFRNLRALASAADQAARQ